MPRETPDPRESIAPPGPFVMDMPEPDPTPFCGECYRDLPDCPGHEDDWEALDCMERFVRAVDETPEGYPLPKTIIIERNRCEDYIRKHRSA